MTAGNLKNLVLAVTIERSPADACVIRVISAGTPVKSHLLALVADLELATFVLHGEANHERSELVPGAGSVNMWLEPPRGGRIHLMRDPLAIIMFRVHRFLHSR